MYQRQKIIKKYPIPWPKEKIIDFRQTILTWYDQAGRDLPWRKTRDPYKVWVSEIMLQQTQVNTVIPYYYKFIEALPNIKALALANESQIMSLWQGLGYYSRVRNMQTAAQQIMDQYQGQMPETLEELLSLKGIGTYTAGAIASICFNLPEPAMDGNLIRIMTRLFEIGEDINKASTKQKIMAYLYQLIDTKRPGDFNQALMDIGATIMTPRNILIESSPIKAFDQSYLNETAHLYPYKSQKIKVTHHYFLAYGITNQQGQWLMRKHRDDELLSQLWHFPLVEENMIFEGSSQGEIIEPLFENYNLDSTLDLSFYLNQELLDFKFPEITHVFSHRKWYITLVPLVVCQDSLYLPDGFAWVNPNQSEAYPFSTLQIKMFEKLT